MIRTKGFGAILLGAAALILILLYSRKSSTLVDESASASGSSVRASRASQDIAGADLAGTLVRSEEGRSLVPGADVPPEAEEELVHAKPPAIAVKPFYALERARCLSSFLTESPDVVGWNGYLEILASNAELGSVHEDGSGIRGTFVIPETGITVEFSITAEGYRVSSQGSEAIGGLGNAEFQTSLAFQAKDGVVSEAHGVVQFHPSDDQGLNDAGLVGYTYETREQETSMAPIRGQFREGGRYWVTVSPLDAGQSIQSGGLGAVYGWMQRLSEVERLQASSRAQRPARR